MLGKAVRFAGFFFLLATMGLAQTQPTVSYSDDFQSYGTPSNPPGWVDTSVGTPKPAADGLYKSWPDPVKASTNIVYGTKQASGKPEGNNPRIGTFSTLTTKIFSARGRFEYRGRMIRTTSDARIGLTFLSSYPEQDKYYLLGLWSKPSDPSRLTLQLFGFGAGTPAGTVDSDLSLDPNRWYQFLIQVDDADNATKIHARFWPEGTTEPATFSIDAFDNSAARLTTGRIGMWAAVRGDAYIDDLLARSPVDYGAPVITFVDADTQRVLDPTQLALFKTPARVEIRVTDDLSTVTSTAKLDDTSVYVSATPIAVDGLHEIKVHAVDAPGNTADASLQLLVDQRPPVVTLQIDGAPFPDGAVFGRDVTLSAVIQDISTVRTVSNLDGNVITLPVPVADEKLHQISVTATDQVGWQTVAAETFIVDKTPPVIEIKANGTVMNGGESFATDVTLTWTATDLTLDHVTATLDNNTVAPGTTVTLEGLHTLVVTATDRAGHSKTETRPFALDKTAPEVHLVANGAPFVSGTTFNTPVTFTAQIQSATPTTKSATIDDQPYTLGNTYGVEGAHTIKLVVTNAANLSTTVGPFPFTIDLTRPTVALTESGQPFHDGMKFARDVNPVVTATDNLTAAPQRTLYLDGNVYPLDTPVSEEKVDHTISATAKDAGGNTASVGPFHFMLDKTKPVVTIVEAESGAPFAADPLDALYARPVRVKITVVDMTRTTLAATVDGAPLAVGADGISDPITGDAKHTVSVVATDEVGNSNDPATASFTIDTTPPHLTFTSHHDGDVVTTPQVVVAGGADDARSASVNDLPATVDTAAKTFTSATLSLVEGRNVITAAGTDKAGNRGSASIALLLDTRAPEIAITAPAADACIDAATLTVSGTAADPRIATVTVNGIAATLDASKGTWTASIPVTEGKLLLTVVATDAVGHNSTVTRSVVIDLTAPAIDVRESGAPFSATLLNRTISLLVRASDADPNVAVSAKLDGNTYVNGATIGEGTHSLAVSATDCAGHKTDKTFAFTIDLTPPAIRNLVPANGATVGQTPNAISGLTDTDAARVEVVGSALSVAPNADGTFTIANVPFADGVNRFTLQATDRAGNSSQTAYAVTVKTAAPIVTILEGGSPLVAGTLFNRPVTPEIKVNDSGATIAATLNGAPFSSLTTITADGNYALAASATDALNHTGHVDTTFIIDRTPPVVKITSPAAGVVTSDHLEVRGTAGDAVSATVNGIPVTLAADGTFVLPSLPIDFGTTPIVATGTDRAGNVGRDEVDVTLADLRPGIIVTYPPDHSLTNRPATEVLGRVLSAPPDGVVTVGTMTIPVDPSGAFRASGYPLVEGSNTITASTKNQNGTRNSASVQVTGDFTPPSLTILESGQPLADDARFAAQAVLTLNASDSGGGTVTSELTLDGTKVVTLPVTVTTTGGHSASAVARDAAGNESRVDRTFFIGTTTGGTGSSCALSDFDPKDGSVVLSAAATLVGRSGGALGVKVNGVAASVADGSFRATVELPNEGANLVTIVCTDGSGNPSGTPVTITLNRITGDPSISIDTPAEGFATASETIAVTGTVGAGVITADVNGTSAAIAGSDSSVARPFTAANVRLADGLNVVVAHGKNGAGRVATASRRVFLLKNAPSITISSPISGISTGAANIYVCGTWTNLDPATIVITNLASAAATPTPGVATSDTTGTFKALNIALVPGEQTLKVTGRDRLNREASATVTVKLLAGAPSIVIVSPADHSYFGPGAGDTFAVSGTFQAAAGSTVEVNGAAATLTGNGYSASIPFATGAGGLTPVVARVTEPGGTSGIAAIVVTKLSAAPKVIESFPAPNAVEVDPGALLLVLFSAPMDRGTLAGGGFRLEDASGNTISGTLYLDKDVATFAPAALLIRGAHYTIRVTTAAKDVAGTALEAEYVAGFTVGASAPSTPPTLQPVAAAFCGQTITIKGTAPAGARLQLESGVLTLPATADGQGNFSIAFPLSGQSGYVTVRVRIVGSDGSYSPAAELTFRVDCIGPQVLNATYERSGANRIAIVFSEAIDAATTNGAISMTLSDGRVVSGTSSTNGANVTVTPAEDLTAKSFSLNVTTAIKDVLGNKLVAPYTQSFSLGTEQPPAGDGTGFISGEIYDATTGRPLAGASISVEVPAQAFARGARASSPQSLAVSAGDPGRRAGRSATADGTSALQVTTTTDARGRYLVRLPEGAHTIRAFMNGYTTVWRQIIVAAGAGVIPIDVRLTKLGDVKSSTGASLALQHGGETSITRNVTLNIPGGVVAGGKTVSLTAVGGQALTGLLPLGWSPVAAAEVVGDLTNGQLAFTVPAAQISGAAQNLTAVRYDELRDTWQVVVPVVNIANGSASFTINAAGAYALVYPDKLAGLAQPALPAAGAPLQGVAAPATAAPLTARTFHLDPPIILPNGRTVATVTIEGLGGATFPSGTAVQAYIDEELKLADGSTLLDPPFATDLLLYRSLAGETGVTDFHLAPSPRAAQVILEVGFDHIRVVPYPGRLDRGTLIGSEGGRVPADDKVALELPTGATPEPLRATASSLAQSDLDAVGSIAGFRVLGGFNVTLQRATEPAPQDLDGDGKPDAVPPVELFKPARATFTVDTAKLPSLGSSLILAELLDTTPYGKMVRLAAQMMLIDPLQAGASARFTTRTIDRSLLPVDGVIREGRYLLLAAEAPIAYATGSVRLGAGGSLLANARVSANALGVADVTRTTGIYNVPVVAAPAGPFTLTPRHVSTGDGASYTHGAPAAAESTNKVDLNLVAQPPALTSVTVSGADSSQLTLSESTITPNVALSTGVRASFSPSLDATSITDTSIVVVDAQTGATVGGKATGDSTGVNWALTPGTLLKYNHRYSVTVSPHIRGTNGASFGRTATYSFTTVVQVTSGEVHADRIGITIPDANGISRVFGTAGALPSGWQAVPVRRTIDFLTRYQATAAADGSFSFDIGNGPDLSDRVRISDLIDLQVVNAAGNLAAIIPLTPFVTADHRGFVAPANIDVKFTSADGIAVTVPAGTFDQATVISVVATTPAAVADVPHIEQDVEYAASVRLEFDGTAKKAMEIELPVPAGFDTSNKNFILGYRGDSIRGPRIMAVDTLRIVDGKFSTTLDPNAPNLRATVMSKGKAGSQQTLTGKDLKNYLMRVQRSGVYMALDIRVPVGGGVGWAVMDGLQASYDIFWDTLASFYAAHYYVFERGRIVVPIIQGKPFTVVGVDSTTGLQGFSKVYDPIPVGDPNVAVTIPSPQENTNGPYPIFGIPFRTEMADVNAEKVDIEEIRNFKIWLENDQISLKPGATPLPADTKIEFFDITNGQFISGTAGQTLTIDGKLGHRVVVLVEQKEIDPSSALTVTFNEPIWVTGADEDAISDFLATQLKLEKADEPVAGANPTYTNITAQVRFRLDSGGRRLAIELPSSLQREAIYRLTLLQDIADRSGPGGAAGLKLAQGTKKDQYGNLQPVGGNNDLHLLFHTRKPGGKLATFDIAQGFVRDIALNGNVLLVTAAGGSDGSSGALMAYDVADPASLNTATGGTPPAPLAKVIGASYTSFWAVASDPHGRVYVTRQGSVLGSLASYRLEDLVAANGGTASQKGASVTNWTLGYSSSIGLISNTILSDRPESIPRKLQVLLQDDDKIYNGRDAFKNATGATESGTTYANGIKKYSVTIPFDANVPYLSQRVTVENLSLDMRWSADATPSGPAAIQNIIALPNDRIKVSKNLRTYGVISHMGYGVGVYDLNAMESNDTPNRPSSYRELQEQVILSPGKNDPACFQPNTSVPKPPDYAIQEIYLSAEAAIRSDAAAPNEIRVYAPDPYRGVLDMKFTPDKIQNNPDPTITPSACDTRAPVGLILRATDPSATHPRIQALMSAFQSAAGRQPFIHFISVDNYSWRREAQDNAKGVRGSTPNAAVSRDYILVAGGDIGVVVVEVGGNPPPSLPSYPPYWPLRNEHVADIIWVPGGAVAVRTIPRTSLAVIVDRMGRVLLADLSRLDERFDSKGNPIPGTPLFATVAKCLTLPATDPGGVGAYDPRIIWKSEPGIVTGTLPPVVDGDTGMLYAGELLRKALKVVAALDPRIEMKVDIGEETGLSEVGGVVPLGISPPKNITDKIDALPACTSGGTARCKENASLGTFRLELSLPGGMVDALSQSNNQLQLAVESERVFKAVTEQTPAGFPRAHLRRFRRDGSPEVATRVATNFKMQRVVPNDPALEQALRRQRGFNKFISPWIVALDDPRASAQYNWNGATEQQKKDAGCEYCTRPRYLDGKTETDGVYELWTNGRLLAVRPEFISGSGSTSAPDSIFANTPYEYLGKQDRLVTRFATIMADTVRPPDVRVAGQNPPIADGMLQETLLLHSGEMATGAVDLVAGGRAGFEVAFDRSYRSRTIGGAFLGLGWESSVLKRLRALPSGDVELRDGGGEIWLFKPKTSGDGYDSPKGLFVKLIRSDNGWKMFDQKWRVTNFDQLGRLSSEWDEFYQSDSTAASNAGLDNGNIIRYLYDDTGRLAQVVDPVNRVTTLTYWKESEANQSGAYVGLLKEIKDWRERTVQYEYDTRGQLKKVKMPEATAGSGVPSEYNFTGNNRPSAEYTYKTFNAPTAGATPVQAFNDYLELQNLEKIKDPAEVASSGDPRVTYTYDETPDATQRDREKSQKWATGETASFTYTSATEVETTDALGQKRKYNLTDRAQYDKRVHVSQETVSEVPTIEVPAALPPKADLNMVAANKSLTTKFQFNDEGQHTQEDYPNGLKTINGWVATGNQGPGKVLKNATQQGASIGTQTTDYTYDSQTASGNIQAVLRTSPNGSGSRDTQTPSRERFTIENKDAGVTHRQEFKTSGLVKTSQKADDQGNVTQDVTPIYYSADATDPITRSRPFYINEGNNVLQQIFLYNTTSTGGYHVKMTDVVRGTNVETDYDAYDRKVHEITRDGTTGNVLLDESFGFDASGRAAYSSRRQKDVGVVATTVKYDTTGREKEHTVSGAAIMGSLSTLTTVTSYDLSNLKLTRYTPGLGGPGAISDVSTLDGLGRTTRRERSGNGASIQTIYGYDAGGAQVYESDTLRTAVLRQPDEMEREVASVGSDGIKVQNVIDQWGQLVETTRTDASGGVVGHNKNIYTKNGRLRATNDEIDNGGRARQTRFAWDDGDITVSSRIGQVGSVAATAFPSAKVRVQQSKHDAAGRVKEDLVGEATGVDPIDSSAIFSSTTYSYQGNVPNMVSTSEPLAGGASSVAITMYDGLGRAAEIAVSGATTSTKNGYDEAGNVIAHTAQGMNQETAQFDSRGLATSRTMADGKTLQYQYDELGNLRTLQDESGESTIYTPDGLGRPFRVQYPDGTTEETLYESGTGLVLSTKNRTGQWLSFEYDANARVVAVRDGQGTSGSVLTAYEYDDAGRLTAVRNKDAAVEYADFDLLGRPKTTHAIRYDAGSGLSSKTLLDIHTQTHTWSIHNEERESWRMPVAGSAVPSADDPTAQWLQTITEERDAGTNIARQLGSGTLLTESTGRAVGKLLLRRQIIGPRTVDTNFGFADGTAPASGVEFPAGTLSSSHSLLIRWTQSKLNGTVVGGSANNRDAAERINQVKDQGLGNRVSQWGYDDRGRLKTSWLNVAGPSVSSSGIVDTLIDADFRSGRTQPTILSQADHTKLGTLAMLVEPLTWTATRNLAQQIGDRTLYLDGQPKATRSYVFVGGRRMNDGKWSSTFDSFGHLTSIESMDAGRKIEYVWDPNHRLVGRKAYKLDSGNAWVTEDRTEVLAKDGLPASVTMVWDPVVDRLVAIFEAGKSVGTGTAPDAGLLRQYLHGDQGYDDPIRVLVAGSNGVDTYLPVVDHAGAGSLQAVVDSTGTMVERVVYADSYGDAPRYLQGAVVDRIAIEGKKNANGDVESVDVRVHLSEVLDSSTVANGVRLAAVDASKNVVYQSYVTPTMDDAYTIHWELTRAEWELLAQSGGESLEVAVGKTLRAKAWGNTPVSAAPEWTVKVYGADTTSDYPVITRQSFADVLAFFNGIPANESKSTNLYGISSLYMAASEESKSKLLFDFHALPFHDPASGIIYARARWYDPATGAFLTPDPMGYRDSSNLYAYSASDPVNGRDPSGECLGDDTPCKYYLAEIPGFFGGVLKDTGSMALNLITLGGYSGFKRAYERGELAEGGLSGGRAYVEGVADFFTVGWYFTAKDTLEQGGTLTDATKTWAGNASGYTDIAEGGTKLGEGEYLEGTGRILEGAGKIAGWIVGARSAYARATRQPLMAFGKNIGYAAPTTPTPDEVATLKSIRRHAERLVKGKATSDNPAIMRRVRTIQRRIATGRFGSAGTHFHSLNFELVRDLQARGFLQNVIVDQRLPIPNGLLPFRRPDYLFPGGVVYDLKPWRNSPSAFATTDQFLDIRRATGRQPIPLYYRLW